MAELLHKTVGEIEAMEYAEFVGWAAYLEIRKMRARK